jgi:hypothetical protein
MYKFAAFAVIIMLRVFIPFTSHSSSPAFSGGYFESNTWDPAQIVSFTGLVKQDKIELQWTVNGNETADQFEVERSEDGKNYKLAALVFGTDKQITDTYSFYEKVSKHRVSYRIKLINRNKTSSYSDPVRIDPLI